MKGSWCKYIMFNMQLEKTYRNNSLVVEDKDLNTVNTKAHQWTQSWAISTHISSLKLYIPGINLNIIPSSSTCSSRWLLSKRYSHQNPRYIITCLPTWPTCLTYHNPDISNLVSQVSLYKSWTASLYHLSENLPLPIFLVNFLNISNTSTVYDQQFGNHCTRRLCRTYSYKLYVILFPANYYT